MRILIVDDQPVVLDALRQFLAMQPDIEIVGEATDGKVAVALAKELAPDVVITDIKMPILGGIAATAAIQEVAPGTKVVILSIYDNPDMRAQALAAGADEFVAKQDQPEELLAVVRRLGGTAAIDSAAALRG